MKTNAKKYFKKYLTDKQLYKRFGLLCFVPLFFSSCASGLFLSERKWKELHEVTINSNAQNVKVVNRDGESFGYLKNGENNLTINVLKRYNTTLKFTHPDMIDTTIKLKRKVRGGALILDFLIFYPAIVYDFITADMYKLKRSSKVINLEMQYSNSFYETKFYNLKSTGTVADYKTYATSYPKSPFKAKAEQKMYELAYEKSSSENTIASYEKHNSDFPQSPFKNEAQNKIYTIAYAFAVNANTQAAYDNYIAKYPNAPNRETAIQNRAKVKQIDDAYASAKTAGTYNAYKDFLTNYAGTKYASEIATKALDAYYNENINNWNTLANCNQAISIISQYVTKYHIIFSNKLLDNIVNKRDQLIIEKLQSAETKENFVTILTDQVKAERLNESDDLDINAIKERVFNNTNCHINGLFNLWTVASEKIVANYQNNKLNGAYTKYAADEKTVLEKGTYDNGNKTGAYLINFENGKKHYNQNYDNGITQNEVEYNESGKIVYEEGLFEGFYESDNYDMSDLVVCFKNTTSGFKPSTNKLCFVENSNTLSRIIEYIDSVIGNHSLLKKIQFKINWKTIIDDGSTMHYAKDYKHYVITGISCSEEMKNTLTTEVVQTKKLMNEKEKEANKPKLGVNYWVSKENLFCRLCRNKYVRTKTKYASTDVMMEAVGPFGMLASLISFNFSLTTYTPNENYCSDECEKLSAKLLQQ
jgi:hypothetical protein